MTSSQVPLSQMPSDAKVADAIVADAIVADTIVAILYLSHLQKVYIYEQKCTNLFAKPCRVVNIIDIRCW